MTKPIRPLIWLTGILLLAATLAACVASAPPPPNPTITSFTPNPNALPSAGGNSTLTWSAANATSFAVTSVPALAGLPTASGGSVTVPANTSGDPVTYALTLTATGAAGSTAATATANITVAAAPNAPTITSFTANPSTFTSAGGSTTLLWSANNATGFQVTSSPTLGGLPTTSGGSVTIPANTTVNPITYVLTLTASGVGGTTPATATVNVTVDAQPVELTKNDWQVDFTFLGGSDRLQVIIDQTGTVLSGSGRDNIAEVDFVTTGVIDGATMTVTFTLSNGGSPRGSVTCTGTILAGPPQTFSGTFTSPTNEAVGGTSGTCTMM